MAKTEKKKKSTPTEKKLLEQVKDLEVRVKFLEEQVDWYKRNR